jgi:cytoskeleton protein RodZ
MSTAPFGDHLRREREMRGVSLEEISAATRISTRFLSALENDQWDLLPGGVFNRGFIRSVARFLGLNEDNLVAEYDLETKHRIEAGVIPDPPMEMRRHYGPAVIAFILLIAILAGAWFGYKYFGAQLAAHLRARHSLPVTADRSPAAAPETAHAAGLTADAGATPAPAADHSPAAVSPAPSGDPTMPRASAATPLQLKIEAGKPADLKVLSDGRTIYDGHVDAGNVMRFEARDSLEITSSDSGALLLELNGQTVAPLGLPGQPGTLTLTHRDVKLPAGGAH